MEPRPRDRVVRFMAAAVSIAYYGLWAIGLVVLVAGPAARLLARADSTWVWGVRVPATVLDSVATVRTRWGPAQLVLEEAHAELQLSIATLPWWLVGVLWMQVAVMLALTLTSLHQLRRIFQRVRDGAPFDAQNAVRMRRLGLALLALSLFESLVGVATSLSVRAGVAGDSFAVAAEPRLNLAAIAFALVLVALAEVFRRGAELELEQSLVI